MFTGIIEQIGVVSKVERDQTNTHFYVQSELSSQLKTDQSVSHDGVCLTVTSADHKGHYVTAIEETLQKSTLGAWRPGHRINLERCMLNNGRFDGHIVQGHVDQTGIVREIEDQSGSWLYTIEFDAQTGNVTVEKGYISINGVSLTCFNSNVNSFSVAIIPYTFEHTNFRDLKKGDNVNLEFDIIGKYVKRLLTAR